MTFAELISTIRQPYVSLLAETAAARRCVVEPPLMDERGELVLDGALNTGCRLDLVVTNDSGADEILRVDSATQMEFDPLEFEIDAMRVTVTPFAWDWVALDVEGLSWEDTRDVLRDWFMRWFDEDDSNAMDEPGLLGVVHYVSDPVEDDDGRFSVTADLGSAPVEVIDDLLFRLLDAGASGVAVGQPPDGPDTQH
jgi:hypothetical protein